MKKVLFAITLATGLVPGLGAMQEKKQESKSPSVAQIDDINEQIDKFGFPENVTQELRNQLQDPQSPLTTPKNSVYSWEHEYKLEKTPKQVEDEKKEMLAFFGLKANESNE